MKILVDVCHPAHVNFFKNSIWSLEREGHEVLVVSRDKDVTGELLDELEIRHTMISVAGKGSVLEFARELVSRNLELLKVVRQFRPDVMTAVGGTFVAQVGWLTRTPSVVFYDTENAKLQNLITYPFSSLVAVPSCYESWLPTKSVRYDGYHELAYLSSKYFSPCFEVAKNNGVSTSTKTFFIRVVSWQANHDVGESGWSEGLLRALVGYLSVKGQVLISSEARLPDDLRPFQYMGALRHVHHVMAFCDLFVGESATMASESVVLGVPAIYAAETGRGYCNEQELKYGLLKNVFNLDLETIVSAVDELLALSVIDTSARHNVLLEDAVDVVEYTTKLVLEIGDGGKVDNG